VTPSRSQRRNRASRCRSQKARWARVIATVQPLGSGRVRSSSLRRATSVRSRCRSCVFSVAYARAMGLSPLFRALTDMPPWVPSDRYGRQPTSSAATRSGAVPPLRSDSARRVGTRSGRRSGHIDGVRAAAVPPWTDRRAAAISGKTPSRVARARFSSSRARCHVRGNRLVSPGCSPAAPLTSAERERTDSGRTRKRQSLCGGCRVSPVTFQMS
jgi:hypothetical protein